MEIELPDGTILDAPDDADPSVVAKNYMAKTSAPPPVTALDRAGSVASGVNSGIAGLLGLPADTAQNVIDLVKAISGVVYNKTTGKPVPEALEIGSRENLPLTGEWFRDKMGGLADNPRPDDTASRYLHAGGAGLGGSLAGPATGVGVIPSAVGGVTGAAASQLAAESGASPAVQVGAGMFAGSVASSARPLLAAGTKAAFRGGEQGRQKVAENIQAFEDAGAMPTAGQATGNRRLQSTESVLSKVPGGAGVMQRTGEKLAADMGAGIEKKAATLAPKSSAEQAGRGIEKGITGEGGFKDAFKSKQGELYAKLDRQIPANAKVTVDNTRKALASLNEEIKGAPELSRFFKNGKLQEIESALVSDVTDARNALTNSVEQALPYEALKKLRTLVGNEISDFSLTSSVPRSKWTALYGALSKDLESAASKAGPGATAAWSRANAYTRAGMRRLEVLDGVINKNGGPEAVFKAATSGTKEGATTLRAVMQSVPKDQQQMVTATVLRRLGRAKPGMQDDLGETFSTETFLTNWNTMAPEAKAVLFNRYGPSFRQDMDQIAKVAANLRDGSKVMRNPSGTATASANLVAAGTAAGALLSGNLATATGVAAGVGGANLSARLLTHPPFVKWLAKTTRAPKEAVPALIAQLAASEDPLLKEAAEALKDRNQ